jgi:DNA-binding NarL/FixJ family response regulator
MKILVADDHALFRDGLTMRLEQIVPEAVILQAANYSQVLKILKEDTPIDMLVLDIEMPDMPWQEAIRNIRQTAPDTAIAVISATEDSRTIRTILSSGVQGYISKRAESKVLNNALKLILEGGTYVPPALIDCSPLGNSGQITGIKNLTTRQSQVLDLIAQGKSNKQIAFDMGVSESTVKLHINALLRSLHVSNRTQAVVTAQKLGII